MAKELKSQTQVCEPETTTSTGPGMSPEELAAAESRLMEGLNADNFRWRSINRLAAMAAISPDQALRMLRANEHVDLGRGKSGRQIAKLKHR